MLGAQGVPRSTDTSAETAAPLVDSNIHDRLDKASHLVDQTHIKFADVSYCGSVNFSCTTLQMLQSTAGFRSGEFGGHSVGEMKSGTFRSRKASVMACSMRQCTVQLKDKTPPWDIRNMSDSSFVARKLSRKNVPLTLTPGSIKWISVQPLISYYLSVM